MKKQGRKRIVTAAIFGVAAFVTMAFGIYLTGCKESAEERKILETPQNVKIVDDYLLWDEVPEAESYVVGINGTEYTTQTNKLDILEIIDKPTDYKMTVCAKGDRERTEDSDWAEKLTYSVSEPEHLVYSQLKDGSYEVSAVNDKAIRLQMTGKLIIPRSYNGRSVTSIAMSGFRECKNLTSVYIPDSVEEIDIYAFNTCTNLTRIRLPKQRRVIANRIFENCSKLKEIDIPEGVTYVGEFAFNGCAALEKVTIPNTVTNIATQAFCDATALKDVEFPSSVQKIGNKAFYGTALEKVTFNEGLLYMEYKAFSECASLTTVHLPASLSKIDSTAFSFCDKLTNLTVAEGGGKFKSDNNCVIDISGETLIIGCSGSVIPNYIKTIGDGAFYGCGTIKNLVIPEGVEKIGVDRTSIDGFAPFEDCQRLESVYIPASVVDLNEINAFKKCRNLKTITVSAENPVYKSDGNCIIRKSDNVLVLGCTGSVMPDYITAIGAYAFFECYGLTKIVIPDGVTEIQRSAFRRCHNVREIYLPKSIKKIEYSAFSECCYASVTIPDSVEDIDRNILSECKGYASFKIIGGYSDSVLAYDDNNYPYVYSTVLKDYELRGVIDNNFGVALVPPCRQGYTFLGWATEEGSDKVVYKPEVFVVKHKDRPGHDAPIFYEEAYSENVRLTLIKDYSSDISGITLYAVWRKNK